MRCPSLDGLHGFVDPELWVDIQKEMHMVGHDFHLDQVNMNILADIPDKLHLNYGSGGEVHYAGSKPHWIAHKQSGTCRCHSQIGS